MIEIEYPMLNRTLCDTLETPERAIEVLLNVRYNLYREIRRIDAQLDKLGVGHFDDQ
jgi:hypothetical protein